MSDTPFTDARTYGFTDEDGIHCEAIQADFARQLERERDYLRSANKRLNRRLTKAEGLIEVAGIVESRQKTNSGSLGRALANYAAEKHKRECAEAQAQLFEALGCVGTIAEDCDAWLNNQCDETACEFIKAVRDYATAIVKDDVESKLTRLWKRGRKAWKDVTNITEWVEQVRGNKETGL